MVNNYSSEVYNLRTIVNGQAREVQKWKHAVCMNTYNDQVKRPPAVLKANTCFIIIITCVASAGLVVGRTHEWTLVGYFKFPKFLCTLNFQNQLRNKPHLHIKGANKLKMRFIPLNFSGITLY